LKAAIREIGHNNFKKEILSTWKTRELAVIEEIRLHDKFDVAKNPLFYNKSKQTNTGFDTTGTTLSEEHKAKIRAKPFKKHTEESKRLISQSKMGHEVSLTTRLKLSNSPSATSRLGKHHTPETKRKMSIIRSGSGSGSAKKINIYDNFDNLIFETRGNFELICLENDLPFGSFRNSYTLSKPVYSGRGALAQAPEMYKKYFGWYATII